MQVLAHGTLVGYEHEVDISVLLVIPVVSRESVVNVVIVVVVVVVVVGRAIQ